MGFDAMPFIALRAMNVGLSPYNNAIISALTSKLAGRYYYVIAWLVAYAKYLFNRPSNALPCLATARLSRTYS